MQEGMGWMVEAEGRGDLDRSARARRREVRRKRVKEGSLVRLSGKWWRAGVREEGVLTYPETGVVQGGVRSPGLANVFLHHGWEEGCEREVRPRRQGRGFRRRVADDGVIGCEAEAAARRLLAVWPKRCARLGLPMPPTKTAWIAFQKPETRPGSAEGNGPGAFLGLTHAWTRSRPGCWGLKRSTARKR